MVTNIHLSIIQSGILIPKLYNYHKLVNICYCHCQKCNFCFTNRLTSNYHFIVDVIFRLCFEISLYGSLIYKPDMVLSKLEINLLIDHIPCLTYFVYVRSLKGIIFNFFKYSISKVEKLILIFFIVILEPLIVEVMLPVS